MEGEVPQQARRQSSVTFDEGLQNELKQKTQDDTKTRVKQVPRRDRDRLAQLFQAWDANKDGVISRSEVELIMNFITDGSITSKDVDALMAAADRNQSGDIDVDEFILWMYDVRNGNYIGDIQPPNKGTGSCADLLQALQDWFMHMDINGNGTLELEELAVAMMYSRPAVTNDQIWAAFQHLDPDGNGHVSWNEFLDEHVRLLDAIPRPIEEKKALIEGRITMLEEQATKLKSESSAGVSATMTVEELLYRLRARYSSTEAAFNAISTGGVVNIVQFRSLVASLLDEKPTSASVLNCVRELFGELDLNRGGDIGLEEFQEVEYATFSKYIPRSQMERKYTALQVISEIVTVIAKLEKDINMDVLERRIKAEKDAGERFRLSSKLEALREQDLSYSFSLESLDYKISDPSMVTSEVFEEFLSKRLARTSLFKTYEKQYGSKAALRISLFGWVPDDLFQALAAGALTISVVNWKDLCKHAPDLKAPE
mmetsp:Transcript_49694/g.118399  ORF Transcript_49694/g.118399 Transcript_49694/m.118399 type:complete len:485 (-) Transcript_49694:135-1589(-)|eukprot:CAMPEP_0178416678 /NCGR_PEP_ID=MMETSP0689_2-20121128/24186_1 /TAXON_ID=160604 /ORGANISM="Amphidinium massartii, Strain CS-259" /LENGTH=484 /DNA_ID=CAMNT_0020038027 /DNA_START=59 /DNA_END=1513 /DNA_ORIENTATION=-